MATIQLDDKTGTLTIWSYNGYSRDKDSSSLGLTSYPTELNFYRDGSNHAYINGKVSYEGDCKNSLIISPYKNHHLFNVKDAFIFVGNSFVEVSPIFDTSNIINKGRRILNNIQIIYYVPMSVHDRETIVEKDAEQIRELVREKYGTDIRSVSSIHSRFRNGGVYYLEDKRGERYVFKHKGKIQERAELLSTIANENPRFFPRAIRRIDEAGYTTEIDGRFYGLDFFIEGETKGRDMPYFFILGEFIQRLHQHLDSYSKKHKNLEQVLTSEDLFLNESSMTSVYLDLLMRGTEYDCLLFQLERMVDDSLISRIRKLSKQLIHRDLNQSNILWANEGGRIIELKSLGFSARINEFPPALLLKGNRNTPKYFKGSLAALVESYNQSCANPLSETELDILPSLLRYALIRYYVIRTIRRGITEEGYLERLKEDLNNLE